MTRTLTLVLLLSATTVVAQPAKPKTAEEHYEASKALYNIEKYDEAIAELKKAYELAREPIYLFNIAQAMRKKADCAGALDYYRKYLRDSPTAQNKPKVEQWMTEMEACAKAQPKVVDPKPIDPIVDPKPVVVVKPVNPKPIVVVEPVDPKPVVTKPRDGKPVLRIAGIATAGAGTAALIYGTVMAVRAHRISNEISDACDGGCNWPDLVDLDAKGSHRATLSKIGFGIGGALVVGGGVLWFLGRGKATETRLAIIPGSDGAVVLTGGRF